MPRYPTQTPCPESVIATQRTVYTIGHGRRDFPSLAADLQRHDVGMIVDVRSAPYSRHAPDFTKDELSHLAAEFNLGYRWLGDRLGGRPDDPALLTADSPDWDKIAAGPDFAAGITELEGLIASSTVVLLCAETDPTHCHRSRLIAPALESKGYGVMHILEDGTAASHQPTLGLG